MALERSVETLASVIPSCTPCGREPLVCLEQYPLPLGPIATNIHLTTISWAQLVGDIPRFDRHASHGIMRVVSASK